MKFLTAFLMCVLMAGCATSGSVSKLQADMKTQERINSVYTKNFQAFSVAINGAQDKITVLDTKLNGQEKQIGALESRAMKTENGLAVAESRIKTVEDELKTIPRQSFRPAHPTDRIDTEFYVQNTEALKNGIASPIESVFSCEGAGCGAVQGAAEQQEAPADNSPA